MKSIHYLFFAVCLLLSGSTLWAQDNCSIQVKGLVTDTAKGKSKGVIQIQIEGDDTSRYKVFLLNKGSDKAREEITDRKLEGVAVGMYEFIIIDTKGNKCFKELTVQVQEAK